MSGRSNAVGTCATRAPRQQLTPAPYALNAANRMSLAGTPLDIKVNGQRALRLEPTAGIPNLIGGSSSNFMAPGVQASFIGGGGVNGAPKHITASSAPIARGSGHSNAGNAIGRAHG